MSRKLSIVLAAVVSLGIVAGGIAPAASPQITDPTTVEVVSKNQEQVVLDLNPAGTQGDMIVLRSPLYRDGVAEGQIGLHITDVPHSGLGALQRRAARGQDLGPRTLSSGGGRRRQRHLRGHGRNAQVPERARPGRGRLRQRG